MFRFALLLALLVHVAALSGGRGWNWTWTWLWSRATGDDAPAATIPAGKAAADAAGAAAEGKAAASMPGQSLRARQLVTGSLSRSSADGKVAHPGAHVRRHEPTVVSVKLSSELQTEAVVSP
mmetsp:Transcript_37912/g.113238  ORF Transcript_37912/g.113238 Transcript_37912/m.113238 type:complete len:122 (-) Transcript_37912:274-639(-)